MDICICMIDLLSCIPDINTILLSQLHASKNLRYPDHIVSWIRTLLVHSGHYHENQLCSLMRAYFLEGCCLFTWGKGQLARWGPFNKGTNLICGGSTLSILQKPHLLTPSHRASGFNSHILGRHKYLAHSKDWGSGHKDSNSLCHFLADSGQVT